MVVADDGSGIDPSILRNLFQFGSSSKGEKGNGMGLWTVKHILSKHGGSIEVSSDPSHGTSFTLNWPREYGTAQYDHEASHHPEADTRIRTI